MATGFLFHELYLWHNTLNWNQLFEPGLSLQPGEHAENPETKRRFRNLLEVSGLIDQLHILKPRPAMRKELLRFHSDNHIDHVKAVSDAGGGDAGELTPIGKGSYEIAQLAVGGTLVACDAIASGLIDNAYVLCRPPGHHALREKAMGFCLFGNAVLGIEHLREVHGVERVAVVDWDVHHGNGTESAFYSDPNVLSISIHQDNLFPADSGAMERTGEGAGKGYNLNIPLPAGSGNGAYLAAVERVVLPALERFKPQFIVVPCGFDASAMDPLGNMMLSSSCFHQMTKLLMQAADAYSNGRILMTHEGGYSAPYVPYCGLSVLEAMSGISTAIEDPWAEYIEGFGGQSLQPHQASVITRAEAQLDGL